MRRRISLILALLVLSACLSGCGGKTEEFVQITSLEQLDDERYTVGVPMGTTAEHDAEGYFKRANIEICSSTQDAYVAVSMGRLDAFAYSRANMECAIASGSLSNVTLLEENVGAGTDVVIGISRKSKVPDLETRVNAFVAAIRSDGTLDDAYDRWVTRGLDVMPDIPQPEAPDEKLVIGTAAGSEPFNYYKGTELTGMDLELIRYFALYMNAEIEIVVLDYLSLAAAAEAGTIDCIFANLNATPERAEVMDFSDPLYSMPTAVMVYTGETARVPLYGSLEEMRSDDITLGVEVGSSFDAFTKKEFPDAKIKYFEGVADLTNAAASGVIDGYITDEPVARLTAAESPKVTWLAESMDYNRYACAFPKTPEGEALRDEVSDFILALKADGTLERIAEAWVTDDRAAQRTDYSSLTGENGVVRMACSFEAAPFNYVRDGEYAGLDLELMIRFCEARGYRLEVVAMNFSSIIQSLGTTCDVGVDSLCVTPEREEEVFFSEPYYEGGTVMIVGTRVAGGQTSSRGSLAASFEKTFIREQRWRLIVQGIGTTVFISFFSALFGTILGFGLCLLRRMKSRVVFAVTTVYIRILQGTPLVVLLMVLYYLVFPHSGLRGEWVAVVAFTMNFAAYVSEMMRTGIESVDIGQTEAALALGFTKSQSFFRFILPQAAQNFLPVYKGEFISLVKMTSVVGYIAVQDLTKMSDIIRSRTYEAFFPLIATALIYFLISWLLSLLLRLVELRVEPDRKNRTVKGVKLP